MMTIGIKNFRIDGPLDRVKLLKGAPLSILTLLSVAQARGQEPVKPKWLARYSGYTDKPITRALALLEEYGLAVRCGKAGWQLSADIQPFGTASPKDASDDLSDAPERSSDTPGTSPETPPDTPPDTASQALTAPENFRQSSSSSSSFLDSSLESRKENLLARSRPAHTEKISERARVLTELDRCGIYEPARSRLAGMAHVTPELVRRHICSCKSTGQAIFRIEHNWEIKGGSWQDESGGETPEKVSDAARFNLEEQETPPPRQMCRPGQRR